MATKTKSSSKKKPAAKTPAARAPRAATRKLIINPLEQPLIGLPLKELIALGLVHINERSKGPSHPASYGIRVTFSDDDLKRLGKAIAKAIAKKPGASKG